eukprot:COSAG05_NODE_689_length_7904_cov_97.607816_7_plen_56_part_00
MSRYEGLELAPEEYHPELVIGDQAEGFAEFPAEPHAEMDAVPHTGCLKIESLNTY